MTMLVPRRAPFRIFPLFLTAAALLLAAWPWLAPAPQLRAPPVTAPTLTEAAALPPLIALTETVRRPVFESLRQPAAKPAEPVPDTAPIVLGRYRLLGIVSSAGKRSAVLAPLAGGGSRLIAAGEALEDWQVAAVGEGDLTLTRGPASQTIQLRQPKAAR